MLVHPVKYKVEEGAGTLVSKTGGRRVIRFTDWSVRRPRLKHQLCHCVIFFFNKFYLLYFWLRLVFVAACRLSLVVASGGYSSLQCTDFSLRWLLLLRSTGSRHAGFSSCGTWAQ